jgi:hypothetical protein
MLSYFVLITVHDTHISQLPYLPIQLVRYPMYR